MKIPAGAVQIEYGRRILCRVLPVPGANGIAVGVLEIEDLCALRGLAPPALAFFRGKNPLALPFVQLRVAVTGRTGYAYAPGDQELA